MGMQQRSAKMEAVVVVVLGPSRRRGFQAWKTMTRVADFFFCTLVGSLSPFTPQVVPKGCPFWQAARQDKSPKRTGGKGQRAKNRMPAARTRTPSRSVRDEAEERGITGGKRVYDGLVGVGRECPEVGPVQERSRRVPSKHAGESINFATLVSSGSLLGMVGRCVTTPCADFWFPGSHTVALGAPLVVQVWLRPELSLSFLLRQDDSDGV